MVQRSKNSISTKPRFSYWFFFYKSLFGNLYSVIELIFQKWIWIMLLCTFKDVQRTIMTILDSLYFLPSSNHKVFFEKPWTLENGYYMATVYLIPSLNTMVVVFKISNGLKSFINNFFHTNSLSIFYYHIVWFVDLIEHIVPMEKKYLQSCFIFTWIVWIWNIFFCKIHLILQKGFQPIMKLALTFQPCC